MDNLSNNEQVVVSADGRTNDIINSVLKTAFGCSDAALNQCNIRSIFITGTSAFTKYTLQIVEGRDVPINTKINLIVFHEDDVVTESEAGEVMIEFEIDSAKYNNAGKRILFNNFNSKELRQVALGYSKGNYFVDLNYDRRPNGEGGQLLTDDGVVSAFPIYRARVHMDEIRRKSPLEIVDYTWLGNFMKDRAVTEAIMEAYIAQDLE